MTPPTPVDLLIEARWIIPIEPTGAVLEHHALAVHHGRIVELLPVHDARSRYLPTETCSLPHHVLLPGLVNTHTHAAMSLMRGLADDLPLMRWLEDAIWPTERTHLSEQFVYDGTLLAGAEMLRSGVTCANDMYFFPDAAARAFDELGMRAMVGMTVIDFPNGYASDADDHLRKGLQVRDKWANHALLSFALAPHAPYTVSDATFEHIASLATELDSPIHLHLHETRGEIEDSLRIHGVRPLQRLHRLGLLGSELLVAHAVHMTDEELDLLAAHKVSVSHNPTSNMKLASGIAPVSKMLARTIEVGLGTDGSASNNRLDIFQEMRHAALLAKVSTANADMLPAHQVLHMATLGGATALGLDEAIGSLRPGKQADLCAIALDDWITNPCFDPASHVIYVSGRDHVSDVWVNGKRRVEEYKLLHPHNSELLRICRVWHNSLRS